MRMIQIGQNDPLAPVASQTPTQSSDAIAAAPARWVRRARATFRAGSSARGDGRRGQVLEQAIELGVGARRVRGVEALVELLRRQPPGGRVLAEPARDLLALGVGGTDGSLGLVHLLDARAVALAGVRRTSVFPRQDGVGPTFGARGREPSPTPVAAGPRRGSAIVTTGGSWSETPAAWRVSSRSK